MEAFQWENDRDLIYILKIVLTIWMKKGLWGGRGDMPKLGGEQAAPADIQVGAVGTSPPRRWRGRRRGARCWGILNLAAKHMWAAEPFRWVKS